MISLKVCLFTFSFCFVNNIICIQCQLLNIAFAESIEEPDHCAIDLDSLARTLSQAILNREYLEARHNTTTDDGLVGLLSCTTVVMRHNPPFKTSREGQQFLKQVGIK